MGERGRGGAWQGGAGRGLRVTEHRVGLGWVGKADKADKEADERGSPRLAVRNALTPASRARNNYGILIITPEPLPAVFTKKKINK